MAKAKVSRKQLFKAALALSGQTAAEWAERNGLTPQWVSLVLNGHEVSLRLSDKMDAFILEQLGNKRTALAS